MDLLNLMDFAGSREERHIRARKNISPVNSFIPYGRQRFLRKALYIPELRGLESTCRKVHCTGQWRQWRQRPVMEGTQLMLNRLSYNATPHHYRWRPRDSDNDVCSRTSSSSAASLALPTTRSHLCRADHTSPLHKFPTLTPRQYDLRSSRQYDISTSRNTRHQTSFLARALKLCCLWLKMY